MSPISKQPLPSLRTMNSSVRPEDCEKDPRHRHSHQACHSVRLRRLLVPALVLFITAAALLFFEIGDIVSEGGIGAGTGLLRRATDGSTNNDTPFVKNKLYLIVIIVGFFLILFAAIALAACCCKGSFQNPICCPCYLCACCGGLACLECLSCGLCAAGLDDLNV